MATLAELSELRFSGILINKITAAIAKEAHKILGEAIAVAARVSWANEAIQDPEGKIEEMMWYLLAENAAFTKAQIEGAADSGIETAVANAVNARVAPPA